MHFIYAFVGALSLQPCKHYEHRQIDRIRAHMMSTDINVLIQQNMPILTLLGGSAGIGGLIYQAGQIKTELVSINGKIDGVKSEITRLESKIDNVKSELKSDITRLESKLDRKISKDDPGLFKKIVEDNDTVGLKYYE